jgi:hypothetical protein
MPPPCQAASTAYRDPDHRTGGEIGGAAVALTSPIAPGVSLPLYRGNVRFCSIDEYE